MLVRYASFIPISKLPLSKLWRSLCIVLLITGCATSQQEAAPVPTTSATPSASVAPSAPASAVENTVEDTPEQLSSDEIAESSSAQALPLSEDVLWERLMAADAETYVVLLRHAIAPGTGDPANFQVDDCATQRNLSEAGRQQAIEIGEAFRQRNIPVAEVLSSQWCRCLETAELMDVGSVEPFLALNSFFRDRSTANSQTAQIKEYIAANSASSGVIIMVTHQVNITALSDIFPQSGSAVVMQQNNGQLEVLGQILESSS